MSIFDDWKEVYKEVHRGKITLCRNEKGDYAHCNECYKNIYEFNRRLNERWSLTKEEWEGMIEEYNHHDCSLYVEPRPLIFDVLDGLKNKK